MTPVRDARASFLAARDLCNGRTRPGCFPGGSGVVTAGGPAEHFQQLCSSLGGANAAWSPSVPISRGYYITKRALCQEADCGKEKF